MRLAVGLIFAWFAAALAIAPVQKPVVVSFPEDTPASVIDKAIEEIKKDGGIITHEYSLIKGFAAKVTEATLDKISTLADSYMPNIEDDYIVRVDGTTDEH